ncbi:MAG TPA: beta-ketoacyl synthase N-terminal-like domain-containing protein [Thermoanaerobaculia bacterium]|nr:beta-ketoacyl synthase N-terminal-like domain-containing protein [Thermoanaerobaculia bacterium]
MYDALSMIIARSRTAAPALPAARTVTVRGSAVLSARETTGRSRFDDEELLARAAIGRRDAKKMDRFALLAVAAARALLSSLDERDRAACGFVCGNMMAGWTFTEPQLRALHTRGAGEVSPYLASAWFPAAPQGQVSIHAGARGYAKTFATDRCAGAQAIGHAWRRIGGGRSRHLLAGGVEAPVSPFVEAALRQSGHRVELLSEAAALLLLGDVDDHDGGEGRGSVVVRAHTSFALARATAAGVTQRLAAVVRRLTPPTPAIVVCSAAPGDAQTALARSIIRDLFPDSRPEVLFPAEIHGETLGASSAIAAATAHRLLQTSAAGQAALIFTLGHFGADALWLQHVP